MTTCAECGHFNGSPYCSFDGRHTVSTNPGCEHFKSAIVAALNMPETEGPKGQKTELDELKQDLKEIEDIRRPTTLDEVAEVLNTTVKHDKGNKLITFQSMLLTFTEEDQINVSFTAESSTGKSYIPLELAWYFPKDKTVEYSYVSPTAFYHEYGSLVPDPEDKSEVEEKKKRKIIIVNLHQKILIFLDQPHDMLLQRLRPLLSHDRKKLTSKITDRRERSGLRTKTVIIEGYPTVLFCSAKFSMEEQERTRLLLLSPETTTDKIWDAILLKIEKESDRQAFYKYMESDSKRRWLRDRVTEIAASRIKHIIIPEELRQQIATEFLRLHSHLIPRHQRDITRLLAMIKAHALLNLWQRQRTGDLEEAILVNERDVAEGVKLYSQVSPANEMGLPPEIYNIHQAIEPLIPDEGVTRKGFQAFYYQTYHRTIGTKRLDEVLSLLLSVGLLTEEPDPNDRRQKMLLPTCRRGFNLEANAEKINPLQGVGNHTPSQPTLTQENLEAVYRKTRELAKDGVVSKIDVADALQGQLDRKEVFQLLEKLKEEGKLAEKDLEHYVVVG